jgi:DNA polymerase III delta subunit
MPPRAKAKTEPVPRTGPPRLFLVTGSDGGAMRQRARELATEQCGSDPTQDPGTEIIVGDRDGARPAAILGEVLESLAAPPFFGPRKVVWLRNFDFAAARKDKRGGEVLDALVERLAEGMPEDVVLILDGPGVDGRSRLIKACRAQGEALVFSQPDPNDRDRENFAEQVRTVIQEHCRARGVRLAGDAAAFLLETVGSDPGRLRGELDKLFAYVHPADMVTLADCQAICSRTPEAAAWAFADALAQRNLGSAWSALDVLMESRAEPVAVMGGVASRFQQMLQARMAAPALGLDARGSYQRLKAVVASPPPQVKADLGETFLLTAHPFRAWKVLSESAAYSDDELRDAFAHLVVASRQLVSGAMDQRLALEQLAIHLCRRQE